MNAQMKRAKADWIKAMTEDFYADEKKNPTTVGAVGIGNTIMVIYATNVDEPLIGVAKCNPYDKYDRELGIAIAYARAIGEELPCYITCDGCNDDDDEDEDDWDEDDDWDDEEDEDEDDWDDDEEEEDEDWDDEEDDEDWDDDYLTFDELGVGAKYLYDDELYIKVSEGKAYRYTDRTTVDFDWDDEIDEVIED